MTSQIHQLGHETLQVCDWSMILIENIFIGTKQVHHIKTNIFFPRFRILKITQYNQWRLVYRTEIPVGPSGVQETVCTVDLFRRVIVISFFISISRQNDGVCYSKLIRNRLFYCQWAKWDSAKWDDTAETVCVYYTMLYIIFEVSVCRYYGLQYI